MNRAFISIIGAALPFLYVFINYRTDVHQMMVVNLQGFAMPSSMLMLMDGMAWLLIFAFLMLVTTRLTGTTKVY